MRSPARLLGAFALAVLLAVVTVPPRADALTKKHPPRVRRARTPAPPPGWVVDRVRFEPLDARRPVGVDTLGSYRGAIDVVPSSGALAVVNELPLEEYLLGISEVPPSWPMEAQRAQAIAARTYAAYVIANPPDAMSAIGADICADDGCQVYAGLAKERRPGAAAWTNAVRTTAGLGLLYKGAPILAKYSSTNGGRTVAGGRPYLRAIDDPDDAVSPYHRWHSDIPLSALAPALGLPGDAFAAQRVGDLIDVEWSSPDGVNAGVAEVAVADFRIRLNQSMAAPPGLPAAVPSTRFELVTDAGAGALRLDGRAWGHGIGMSQFGALGKALRGMRAAEILAMYYGGLRPVALPAPPRTVRVALDSTRSAVTLAAEGRFRVLDGNRHAIAVVGAGAWRVVPAPRGRVRVLPPPEQAGTPVLTSLVGDATTSTGQRVDVRFRLSLPAAVRVTVRPDAGGPETVVASRLVEAGDIVQSLPAPSRPGGYVVTLRADAGAGRTTTLPVALRVVHRVAPRPPKANTPLVAAAGWWRGTPRALAALLLAAVSGLGWTRRVEVASTVRVQFEALRDRRGA
jgi:stage II sporulation protein D